MANDIKRSPLADLVSDILDRRGLTPIKLGSQFATHGHRVISAKLMKDSRLDLDADEPRFVDTPTYRKWMQTPLLPDDVILTSEAPLGEVAYIDRKLEWCLGQRLFGIRTDKEKLHGRYLFYALKSEEVQNDLRSRATGSTVQGIRQSELRRVQISHPDIPEQQAIAAVLGALDDKIELNRRMNATLEAIARALFADWIASHELQERLVQELIDERTLLIGDGYRAKNSEMASDGLPFARAGNLKADGLDLQGSELLSARGVAAAGHKIGKVGDVAFTSKGTVGRITRVSTRTGTFVYSPQICFWRTTSTERLNPNVLYRWMSSHAFTRQVAAVSTQTDMAPYVSLRDQRRMIVALPAPSAQQEIAKQLEAIDHMIAANASQSRTLGRLRDILLPQLLSGAITVRK